MSHWGLRHKHHNTFLRANDDWALGMNNDSSSHHEHWVIRDEGWDGHFVLKNRHTGGHLRGNEDGSVSIANGEGHHEQWFQVNEGSHVSLQNRATRMFLKCEDGWVSQSNNNGNHEKWIWDQIY